MVQRQKNPPPALHELEAEVMDVVWAHGERTVREVMSELNSRSSQERAYTTFMTVMSRLYAKGLLERRREGKTDIYRPVMTREAYRAARAETGVSALVDEFGEIALASFARQMASLDPARRRVLQRLARKG